MCGYRPLGFYFRNENIGTVYACIGLLGNLDTLLAQLLQKESSQTWKELMLDNLRV